MLETCDPISGNVTQTAYSDKSCTTKVTNCAACNFPPFKNGVNAPAQGACLKYPARAWMKLSCANAPPSITAGFYTDDKCTTTKATGSKFGHTPHNFCEWNVADKDGIGTKTMYNADTEKIELTHYDTKDCTGTGRMDTNWTGTGCMCLDQPKDRVAGQKCKLYYKIDASTVPKSTTPKPSGSGNDTAGSVGLSLSMTLLFIAVGCMRMFL